MFENENPARAYPAGAPLFAAGDPGDVMYVVKTGEVDILVGEQIVETVGPNGIFGEMALIDNESRSASARARTDCQLVTINPKQFLFMVHETPYFAIEVMRTMSQRLRNRNRAA
jgi:CRP-like cAMP-binding protein